MKYFLEATTFFDMFFNDFLHDFIEIGQVDVPISQPFLDYGKSCQR